MVSYNKQRFNVNKSVNNRKETHTHTQQQENTIDVVMTDFFVRKLHKNFVA